MNHEEDYIEEILSGALSEECRAEVDEVRAAFAALAHTVPPVAPPAHLREFILEGVRAQGGTATQGATQADEDSARTVVPFKPRTATDGADASSKKNRARTFGLIAASLLVLALLISLLVLGNLRAERDRLQGELAHEREASQLLTQAESHILALNGTAVAPRADGRVAYDRRTGQVAVFVHDLPPAPAGKAYQLWFLTPDARKIPSTVFSTNAGGGAVVRGDVPAAERANTAGFAITLEPQTGSTSPTSEIYLASPTS